MPYTISAEERVNAYTQNRQSAPQTVALADGGYLTVWSGSGQADEGYGVYLQRFDAAGQRVGEEILVNTTTTFSQRNPEVTVLASGGYVVTWDSTVPGGGPGDPSALGVFVQAFDAAGARIGAQTQVSGVGHSQRVTALADGGYVVTWTQQVDAPWSGVLAQRFDASGRAVGQAVVLDRDLDATVASVAATDTGFIAVWRAYNEAGGATIAIQSFGADGERLGDEVRIPRDGDRTHPEIVALADGGFALVWLEAEGLFGQILGDDGRPAGDRFLVGPAAGGQLLHAIVATPDGGFTVAWDRFSGAGSHILEARAFFADGRPNGETISIRDASGSPGEPPALTTLASGEVVLTYARYVGDLVDYFDVFQVRLEPLVRTQRGSEADDQLTGRSEADRLMGLEGADFLLGLEGDDTLVGGLGNDVLDGGAGRDEAVFAGSADSYLIFEEAGGYRVKGPDGSDLVTEIELLRFDDRTIDLTMTVCYPPPGTAAGDAGPQVLPGPPDAFGKGDPDPVPPPGDPYDDPLILPDSGGNHGAPGFRPVGFGGDIWTMAQAPAGLFAPGPGLAGRVEPPSHGLPLDWPGRQDWDWQA